MKFFLYLVFVLICLSLGYGAFYDGWWKFIPSTFMILGLTRLFYPKDWRLKLGLVGSYKSVVVSLLLCFTFACASYFAIVYSLPVGYILGTGTVWDYLTNICQTLNEEFFFRALVLNFLLAAGFGKWKTILVPALIFSFFHWFFFAFNMKLENRGSLDYSALLTLFLFSVSTGLIFVKTKSILIPWAFHYAWNFHRFGSGIINLSDPEKRVPEYLTFNLLEGSNIVFALCCFVTFVSYYLCEKVLKEKEQGT